MTKEDIERLYGAMLRDPNFSKIGLLIAQPNIFSALGIGKYEIRHSNFLAWLLKPTESHGLGDLFLIRFLRDILLDEKCNVLSLIDFPKLNLSKATIYREWNNIDLVIEVDELVVAVENKFLSREHSDQLKRYKKSIEEGFPNHKRAYVYLTPFGNDSSEKGTYVNYSYERIVEILSELLDIYKSSLNSSTYLYVDDYIHSIKTLVMENSPINDLAQKIYNNHKELLDVIFEVKPDSIRVFDEVVRKFIISKKMILGSQAKGYVRFLPGEINNLIPKGQTKGWPLKESFLFEISNWNEKKMVFKAVVSPGDEEAVKLLCATIAKVPGALIPSGDLWLTYFSENIPINHKLLTEKGEEFVIAQLESNWAKIEQVVNKISAAILSNKKEFDNIIMTRTIG